MRYGAGGVITALAAAAIAVSASAPVIGDDGATASAAPTATYINPISGGTVDTFPDPAIIRAHDGYWYSYATGNPIFNSQGETHERWLPIMRSSDLVDWDYMGEAVPVGEPLPSWESHSRPWAPDIRYVNGKYLLTYSLSSSGIGLLSSESPTGPWEDHGLLIGPATMAGCNTNNIDQQIFTDIDGTHYFYWGSYDRLCVAEMNADATAIEGEAVFLGQARRMEAIYMVHRDGYYYLMYSDAGCCDGAFSGYTVKVGRSASPLGPFLDEEGNDLRDLSSKGSIVLAANGNRWSGPGHHAVATDAAGQDWIVYHAVPTDNPEFGHVDGAPSNLSVRPMLIDRLDWIDGWPVARAGAGPSQEEQPAPVTAWSIGGTFNDSDLSGWEQDGDDWALVNDAVAGEHLRLTPTAGGPAVIRTTDALDGDVRIEADVRLGSGSGGTVGVVRGDIAGDHVRVEVNRATAELIVTAVADGTEVTAASALPATYDHTDWHRLAVKSRGDAIAVDLTMDGLRQPLALAELTLPAGIELEGTIGAVGAETAADVDNLGAAELYVPVTTRIPEPVLGDLLPEYSDEFAVDGDPADNDDAWSWVRGGATSAAVEDGVFVFPTQTAELHTGNNTASVLLRDAPEGDYVIETQLDFDPQTGNQNAGILLYENDNRYVKLAHSMLPVARVGGTFMNKVEFGKEAERPGTTPPTVVANGPMFGPAPATTTWLRIMHTLDEENDEHDFRMASSTDGETWTWGGSWTFPIASGDLQIGLVSMNVAGVDAGFHYLRTYEVQQAPASFSSQSVSVAGGPFAGATLTASVDSWSPTPSALAYTWLRDGEPIADATGPQYTPGLDDVGSALSVAVRGTLEGYSASTATSAETTVVSGTLTIDPATPVPPGSGIEVTGTGFAPHAQLALQLGSADVATVTTDADGDFDAEVTLPSSLGTGEHQLTALSSGVLVASVALEVIASDDGDDGDGPGGGGGDDGTGSGDDGNGDGSDDGELSDTGPSGLLGLVGGALALLVAGLVIAWRARARRSIQV